MSIRATIYYWGKKNHIAIKVEELDENMELTKRQFYISWPNGYDYYEEVYGPCDRKIELPYVHLSFEEFKEKYKASIYYFNRTTLDKKHNKILKQHAENTKGLSKNDEQYKAYKKTANEGINELNKKRQQCSRRKNSSAYAGVKILHLLGYEVDDSILANHTLKSRYAAIEACKIGIKLCESRIKTIQQNTNLTDKEKTSLLLDISTVFLKLKLNELSINSHSNNSQTYTAIEFDWNKCSAWRDGEDMNFESITKLKNEFVKDHLLNALNIKPSYETFAKIELDEQYLESNGLSSIMNGTPDELRLNEDVLYKCTALRTVHNFFLKLLESKISVLMQYKYIQYLEYFIDRFIFCDEKYIEPQMKKAKNKLEGYGNNDEFQSIMESLDIFASEEKYITKRAKSFTSIKDKTAQRNAGKETYKDMYEGINKRYVKAMYEGSNNPIKHSDNAAVQNRRQNLHGFQCKLINRIKQKTWLLSAIKIFKEENQDTSILQILLQIESFLVTESAKQGSKNFIDVVLAIVANQPLPKIIEDSKFDYHDKGKIFTHNLMKIMKLYSKGDEKTQREIRQQISIFTCVLDKISENMEDDNEFILNWRETMDNSTLKFTPHLNS